MTDVPPVPPIPKQPRYATHIPKRSPQWKYHVGLGMAKNAVNTQVLAKTWGGATCNMQIWQLNEETNQMELLFSIAQGTLSQDLPWKDRNAEVLKARQTRLSTLRAKYANILREFNHVQEEIVKIERELEKELRTSD